MQVLPLRKIELTAAKIVDDEHVADHENGERVDWQSVAYDGYVGRDARGVLIREGSWTVVFFTFEQMRERAKVWSGESARWMYDALADRWVQQFSRVDAGNAQALREEDEIRVMPAQLALLDEELVTVYRTSGALYALVEDLHIRVE